MGSPFQKIFRAPDSGEVGSSTNYQERAIFFAQAVLATARAFPTRATPEIPDKEYTALVLRVKEAADFLVLEGIHKPRFAPVPHG